MTSAAADPPAPGAGARSRQHTTEGRGPLEPIRALTAAFATGSADLCGFAYPHWARLRRSPVLGAPVRERLGGAGSWSVHDLCLLARGDPSTALGLSMHLASAWSSGDVAGVDGFSSADAVNLGVRLLRRAIAWGRVVCSVAVSELGRPQHQLDTRCRAAGDAWRLSGGRQTFCTNSPAADLFIVVSRIEATYGPGHVRVVLVSRSSPGVQPHNDGQVLGMAAFGSGTLTFDDSPLDQLQVMVLGDLDEVPDRIRRMTDTRALLATSVLYGAAEQAQSWATRAAARGRPAAASLVGDNEIDLAMMRVALLTAANSIDLVESIAAPPADDPFDNAPDELNAQPCAIVVRVKRLAVTVVDRAMSCVGGAGYVASHPIATLYRDVRAGRAMRPWPYPFLDGPEILSTRRLDHDPNGAW